VTKKAKGMIPTIGRTLVVLTLVSVGHAQMQKQKQCADVVKADIEKTRSLSPDVYNTIKTYTFEYSKSRDSCVIIMQYRVPDKDEPKVQVLALNAVTMQSMAGNKEVYVIPARDTKQIDETADLLFQKYSH
jgi:hypothetical protein